MKKIDEKVSSDLSHFCPAPGFGWQRGWLALLERPDGHAVGEQDAEHNSVLDGLAVVGFHEPRVMHNSKRRREIDETVQALPVFATEAANGPCG